MSLRFFRVWMAALAVAVLSVACGGGSTAPTPSGLTAVAGETTVTVTWAMDAGVEYWLFLAPTSVAPTNNNSMHDWFGLTGGNVLMKVSSPYVVSGLTNGTSYSFSVNGRISGGPGGAGAPTVSATPRLAGASWTLGTPVATADFNSLTLGAKYVAAGNSGALYSSTDGTTWTAITPSPTTSKLNGASYLGTYKVVGNGGEIFTSSDAVTWTQRSSGTTKNLYAIASNGLNLSVAVGEGGTILTSADGVAWTAATSSATSSDLYAVTFSSYSGGTWIAVGAGGTIVTSTNGLVWTDTLHAGADLRGVASGLNASNSAITLVAVGASGTALSSTNSTTWTSQTLTGVGTNTMNAVTYGTQFVTVGNGGMRYVSTDGATWTQATTSATTANLMAVVRGPLSYVAVGAAGTNLLAK